jgi:hypothetical protein
LIELGADLFLVFIPVEHHGRPPGGDVGTWRVYDRRSDW